MFTAPIFAVFYRITLDLFHLISKLNSLLVLGRRRVLDVNE